MNLPKFIITLDGYFRFGQVNQHKHLLKPGDQCIGGGYYHFDFVEFCHDSAKLKQVLALLSLFHHFILCAPYGIVVSHNVIRHVHQKL